MKFSAIIAIDFICYLKAVLPEETSVFPFNCLLRSYSYLSVKIELFIAIYQAPSAWEMG